MNEIKITLSIPGLPEAINNLAEAIKGYVNTIPAPVPAEPAEPAKCVGEVATQPDSKADVSQASVTPVSVEPQNTTPSAPATPVTPATPAVNYTIDQLSVAGAALCEQGKMAQLISLLGKYGVQAVTQLKPTPDVLNQFAAEMKALGANL